MLDHNNYPDEDSLKIIETFDLMKPRCFGNLSEFVKLIWENWNYADYHGFKYYKENGTLELHTFGWSGNEDVIEAMKKNFFWFFFWEMSVRGGHYWFKLYQFEPDGKTKIIPELEFLDQKEGTKTDALKAAICRK